MKFIRGILIASILIAAYDAVLVLLYVRFAWLAFMIIVIATVLKKKTPYSDSHGSSRWARPEDMPHLLEGEGLMIGEIEGRISRVIGIKALFNLRFPAFKAVQQCLWSLRRKQPRPVVRLTQAVHTAIFAPTSAGKGVSVALPHLLTCPDSMVVLDLKGENALVTAEYREKVFGHKVIILDPFHMVTHEKA